MSRYQKISKKPPVCLVEKAVRLRPLQFEVSREISRSEVSTLTFLMVLIQLGFDHQTQRDLRSDLCLETLYAVKVCCLTSVFSGSISPICGPERRGSRGLPVTVSMHVPLSWRSAAVSPYSRDATGPWSLHWPCCSESVFPSLLIKHSSSHPFIMLPASPQILTLYLRHPSPETKHCPC